jgi:hypothetical protein
MKSASSRPWDLPLEGFEVLQVTFGDPIDIGADGDGGVDAMIMFDGTFRYVESDVAASDLDASKDLWEDLTLVLALRRDRLRS